MGLTSHQLPGGLETRPERVVVGSGSAGAVDVALGSLGRLLASGIGGGDADDESGLELTALDFPLVVLPRGRGGGDGEGAGGDAGGSGDP